MPPDVDRALSTALVERRAAREPVAYITGHREFWGLDFDVTPDVLIPRPETELIIEEAVCERRNDRDVRDGLSTWAPAAGASRSCWRGSSRPEVVATDISAAALSVAAGTPSRHRSIARSTFVRGDLLEPVQGPVDVIVSNPPYVPIQRSSHCRPRSSRIEPPVGAVLRARRAHAREAPIAGAGCAAQTGSSCEFGLAGRRTGARVEAGGRDDQEDLQASRAWRRRRAEAGRSQLSASQPGSAGHRPRTLVLLKADG